MNILEKIVAQKKEEVALAKKLVPLNELRDSEFFARPTISLKESLHSKAF